MNSGCSNYYAYVIDASLLSLQKKCVDDGDGDEEEEEEEEQQDLSMCLLMSRSQKILWSYKQILMSWNELM